MHPNVSHFIALYYLPVSFKYFEKDSTVCQVAPCYYSKIIPTASLDASDLTLIGSIGEYTLSTSALVSWPSRSWKALISMQLN